MLSLDKISELMEFVDPEEKAELDKLLLSDGSLWCPLPGPQTLGWESEADILFYGGAAGGGKSDLIIGLALDKHVESIIYRRESPQLKGIIKRITNIVGNKDGYNGQGKVWNLPGRSIEFGSVQHLNDKEKYQGRPHDFKAFDEITHFLEEQFRFLIGWLRSENPEIKQRIVCTGNPPTTDEGAWVREYWGAWLDPLHPLFGKVKHGQLLWYTTIDGKDKLMMNGKPFMHVHTNGKEELITPMSRTFIPAKVQDNPYLMRTGYLAILQALPEPLRSQMKDGDFTAGTQDHEKQCIPSEWVEQAMARWRPRERKGPMDSMGVDVARGGQDDTTIARRHDNWFDEILYYPGVETPDGPSCAAKVIENRRDRAPVHIDVIGVGSSPTDFLQTNNIHVVVVDVRKTSVKKDTVNNIGYYNVRSEIWCELRESLNPINPDRIDLPPDPKLKSELTMVRRSLTVRGWKVESRDDIIGRLGRSPDAATAVCQANIITVKHEDDPRNMGRGGKVDTDYDPLEHLDD